MMVVVHILCLVSSRNTVSSSVCGGVITSQECWWKNSNTKYIITNVCITFQIVYFFFFPQFSLCLEWWHCFWSGDYYRYVKTLIWRGLVAKCTFLQTKQNRFSCDLCPVFLYVLCPWRSFQIQGLMDKKQFLETALWEYSLTYLLVIRINSDLSLTGNSVMRQVYYQHSIQIKV